MFNAVTEKGGLRLNQGTQGSHRLVCIGNNAPSQILVLGIHHSGTSVLTNMTLELGAYGGDRADFLLVEKNPMKWWERRDVVKHDQERLDAGVASALRERYKVPSWVAYGFERVKGVETEASKQARTAIIQRLNARRPWVTKDPRMALLAPEWIPDLESPVCVIVHRDPLAAADSIMQSIALAGERHNLSLAEWSSMYEHYYATIMRACTGVPTVVVQHEEITHTPFEALKRLHHDLVALGVQGLQMPTASRVHQLIRPMAKVQQRTARMSGMARISPGTGKHLGHRAAIYKHCRDTDHANHDTTHGGYDLDGYDCATYTAAAEFNQQDWCGGFWDDDDFSSQTMCCQCGGGDAHLSVGGGPHWHGGDAGDSSGGGGAAAPSAPLPAAPSAPSDVSAPSAPFLSAPSGSPAPSAPFPAGPSPPNCASWCTGKDPSTCSTIPECKGCERCGHGCASWCDDKAAAVGVVQACTHIPECEECAMCPEPNRAGLSEEQRVRAASQIVGGVDVISADEVDAELAKLGTPVGLAAAPSNRTITVAGDAGSFLASEREMISKQAWAITEALAQGKTLNVEASPWASTQRLSKQAIATLLTTNDTDYLRGALVLGSSIRSFDSSRDMIVLVTKDVPREWHSALAVADWRVIEIDEFPEFWVGTERCSKMPVGNQQARWGHMANKFRLWQQTQYERIMYLDADAVLTGPVSDLFETVTTFAAETPLNHSYFNAGVMMLTPSEKAFREIVALSQNTKPPRLFGNVVDCTEQALLITYYNGQPGREVTRLPIGRADVITDWNSPAAPNAVHWITEVCPKPWVVADMARSVPEHCDPVMYRYWRRLSRRFTASDALRSGRPLGDLFRAAARQQQDEVVVK